MASMNFDANAVEPNAPRDNELLPPGDYLVQFVRSEVRPNKAGTGELLELEADIVAGPHERRKIWDRLNIVNQNPTAQEIARGTLSAICRAVGQMNVQDSEQLHFKPLIAKVVVKPGSNGYGPKNEVKGYLPADGAAPAAASRPAASPPPVKAAASTPPWRKTA